MAYQFRDSVKVEDGKTLIKADRLRDIVSGYDGDGSCDWDDSFTEKLAEVVLSEITDTSRWSIHHHCVFKIGGKYYSTHYSRGATESQDEAPYEYEGEWIEVMEVVPVPVTVTKYEPILERGVVVYEEPCPEEGVYILSDEDYERYRKQAECEYGEDIYAVVGPAVRTASGWHEVKTEGEAV